MMRLLLASALLVGSAYCRSTPWHKLQDYTFEHFEREFAKEYAQHERDMRKQIVEERLADIVKHNSDPFASYKKGVNHMLDLTSEELSSFMGIDKSILLTEQGKHKRAAPTNFSIASLPKEVDWRKLGVVTPVKNQGSCGSCWVFGSVATMESHWAIETGELWTLSEQFVLDCTDNPHECGGEGGCHGGTAALSYDSVINHGGIPSDYTYAYLSGNNGTAYKCHGLPLKPRAKGGDITKAASFKAQVHIPHNDYSALMHAVATYGPMTISVDASTWHLYEKGVYDGGNLTNPTLNHLVQLVGYGTDEESGLDYWLVRNSWTPLWGELGYIRLRRYGEGKEPCGEDLDAKGHVCKGEAPTLYACGQNGILYDAGYPIVNVDDEEVAEIQ